MGVEPNRVALAEEANKFAERMKKLHEEAKAALGQAAEEMKRYADRKRAEVPKYKKGDKVMISTKDLKLERPSRKLSELWIGPYEIIDIVNENAVTLKLPSHITIHPTISTHRLKPYHSPVIPGQVPQPPPPTKVQNR